MRRVLELVDAVNSRFPENEFFAGFLDSVRQNPAKRRAYETYQRALVFLDEDSWGALREKAVAQFQNRRNGRMREAFFNTLNEAFAYRSLKRWGHERVRIPREVRGVGGPDVLFISSGRELACEVKTIGITDAEDARRRGGVVFDASAYSKLPLSKLRTHVTNAIEQLGESGGLVYVIVEFDDISDDHVRAYRNILSDFVDGLEYENIYLRLRRGGAGFIRKGSISRLQSHKV